MVIEKPKLTVGPKDAAGIKEHANVYFECHFNTSLIQYLAICGWLKDGDPASNGRKWQTAEPGFENHLVCGFTINNVLIGDEGSYSCYCYYNKSFNEQFHIPEDKEIKSQSGKAELQIEMSKTTNFWYVVDLYFLLQRTMTTNP